MCGLCVWRVSVMVVMGRGAEMVSLSLGNGVVVDVGGMRCHES